MRKRCLVWITVAVLSPLMILSGCVKNNKDGQISSIERSNTISEPLYVVRDNHKWGFVNGKGEVVIEPKYDMVSGFSEGRAAVYKNRKAGFIDETGKIIIDPVYDYVGNFIDGIATAYKDGKTSLIDKNGKVIQTLDYQIMHAYQEKLLSVYKDHKYGYIDLKGNLVIPLEYDNVESFSEDLAKVYKDGKSFFIDSSGNKKLEPDYESFSSFHDAFALVMKNKKYGFINKEGEEVIPLIYDGAINFSEGLAPIKKGDKWGYIDKQGKEIIQPIWDQALGFEEGLAPVKKGNLYGYINKKGEMVIKPQFTFASSFENGCSVVGKDDDYTLIDQTGKILWKESNELNIKGNKDLIGKIVAQKVQDQPNVDLKYPEVKGMKDKDLEQKMNKIIDKELKTKIDYQKDHQYKSDYFVQVNQKGIVSILVYMMDFSKENIKSYFKTLTMNMETGKVYKLYDLFKNGEKDLKTINPILQKEMKKLYKDISIEYPGIGDIQGYYLTDNQLVIIEKTNESQWFNAIGMKEYFCHAIDYEKIKDILNPNGPILSILK